MGEASEASDGRAEGDGRRRSVEARSGVLLLSALLLAALTGNAVAQPAASSQPARASKPAKAQTEQTKTEKAPADDIEILKITEKGIEFKDESGKVVKIADFEQLSLESLLQEEIVTTAGRRAQRAWASPSAVSVLTRRDIESAPYLYLGDLLGMLPGVYARWGKMQRMYVGVRGLGGTALNSRLLLLWDGVPLNDPFTGELSGGQFTPLVDVERIEMIRGPGSTLYGANAFSGVVNVITTLERPGVRASLLTGNYMTSRAQARFMQPVGAVKVSGSVEAFRTDGPFPEQQRQRSDQFQIVKNDDVTTVSLSGAAAYKGLRLAARYTYGERGRPGTFPTDKKGNIYACATCHNSTSQFGQGIKYPATTSSCGSCHMQPDDREQTHRIFTHLSFNHDLGKGFQFSANVHHNEWRTTYTTRRITDFLRSDEISRPRLNQRATGAETHLAHRYKELNSAVVGAEMRRLEVSSDLLVTGAGNQTSQFEAAAFLEDEFRPLSWLSLTAGTRFDYNQLFGAAVSPRGGLVVTPIDRLALRASIGRAFRNPALSELYVLDTRGKYAVFGDSNLKREWVTSLEGGVTYTLLKPLHLKVALSVYYNMVSDLINFRAFSSEAASFYNVGNVKALGGELELDLEVLRKPGIRVFGNYSLQRVRDENDKVLPYAPAHKANFGVRFAVGRFAAMTRVRWISMRTDDLMIDLPGFVTVDASAKFDIWRGVGVQFWAQNLGDQQFQESLGIPAARRSFFVSLTYDPQ